MRRVRPIVIILAVCILCIIGVSIYGFTSIKSSSSSNTLQLNAQNPLDSNDAHIKTIILSKSTLTITEKKKGTLKATIQYTNDSSTKEGIIWTSKNKKVATVDQQGIVKAISAGSTYIICSSQTGSVKTRCKIVVTKPYTKIKTLKLDKSNMRIGKKTKRYLSPIVTYTKKTSSSYEPIIWSSSNNKVATVNQKGVVKGKSNGTATITAKAQLSNKKSVCKVTVAKTKYIAITFDDGPGEYTNKLLKQLNKYNAKATFFVLGSNVGNFKSQLTNEYNSGMEIGSHTYSHANLKVLSTSKVKSEISKTNSAIKKIIGTIPTVLRPPYGNYNKAVEKYAGVPMIYWSVDTEDWKHRDTNYICQTLIKTAGDGEIVLLHDIHPTSVNGFIKALPTLKSKGYEFVTVSELYKIKGKKMKSGVMYYGPKYDR